MSQLGERVYSGALSQRSSDLRSGLANPDRRALAGEPAQHRRAHARAARALPAPPGCAQLLIQAANFEAPAYGPPMEVRAIGRI